MITAIILNEISKIDQQLMKISDEKARLDYRERNARAGFVYIISNIGSFGEGIYKIGMTRRLEPEERVRELGSAPVPFTFDVHAMIFSEDAPSLETELHHTFHDKRVNKVNSRKEFFRVNLKEIEKVVKEKHNGAAEFKMTAIAQEYRETLMKEKRTRREGQI